MRVSQKPGKQWAYLLLSRKCPDLAPRPCPDVMCLHRCPPKMLTTCSSLDPQIGSFSGRDLAEVLQLNTCRWPIILDYSCAPNVIIRVLPS